MPGAGASLASTTKSVVSGNSASVPAFLMPALGTIWPVSAMQGKAIQVIAAGTYDATAVGNTLQLYADPTQASTTSQILLAGTGSVVVVSTTTGSWNMELTLTCTGTGAVTSSNWMTAGVITYGVGNNAGTAGAAVAMVGGANALGVPTALTLSNITSNYWELWSTWATAPTAFVCSQFMVMGLN
jgi:hypothetical protein